MRVDKSDFYMHCRLHSLQAAVHFLRHRGSVWRTYGGRFFCPSDNFHALPMSLCRSGMGVCCTCADETVQIV